MNDRAVHAIVNAIINRAASNSRANGNIAARKRFRKTDNIRLQSLDPLAGQKAPCAPHARLNFVADH